MKNKKKARIDTYNTIYDMDVVVANELVTLKKLRELFEYTDGKELEELYTNWDVVTGLVKRKSDGAHTVLIKFNKISDGFVSSGDKLLDMIDICSHEATHAALDIYNSVSATVDMENQENFAYFVAYIAERAAKTLLDK